MESTEEDVRRGERAKQLLQDPLLVEAFEILEQTYTDAWKATLDGEGMKRDRLWLMLKLSQRVKGHLEEAMESGEVSRRNLEDKVTLAQRIRRVI